MAPRTYTNAQGETMTAPQTVRAWRQFIGLSHQALAERARISISSAVNLDRNGQIPTVPMARRVAQALGVEFFDVLWPDEETVTRRPRKTRAA